MMFCPSGVFIRTVQIGTLIAETIYNSQTDESSFECYKTLKLFEKDSHAVK